MFRHNFGPPLSSETVSLISLYGRAVQDTGVGSSDSELPALCCRHQSPDGGEQTVRMWSTWLVFVHQGDGAVAARVRSILEIHTGQDIFVAVVSVVETKMAAGIEGQCVQAHGYMEKPLAEFKEGTDSPSAWVVQIEPQWKGDWDNAKGDEGLVALYKELKKSNNAKDIRTMLDSDTKLYGQDCGFTDPNATPKDPPTTGDATFSRGIVHAGPCKIWLDDKMVLQNDDCQSAYGDGTKKTISVFKPVDYSSCPAGGCMFRFYWLALQRLDGKTWWQVYKNCVPLSGPAGGGSSQTTQSSGSSTSQTLPSSGESDSPSSGESESPSSGESDSPSSSASDSPSSGASESPSSGDSESPSSGESDSPSSGESESPSSGDSDSPSTESTPAPESPSVETPDASSAPLRSSRSIKFRPDQASLVPQLVVVAAEYHLTELFVAATGSPHFWFCSDRSTSVHSPLLPCSAAELFGTMVSTSTVLSVVAGIAASLSQVNAHGYMYIPLSEFTDSVTSAWIVQIEPQWAGNWDSCSSSDDDCLTTLYTSLKSSNGYSDIRTLLDSDTSLYGANCGFTNPDATPKDPPTTGDATFSRGMVHAGPCEIWLDDTMVLSNDDCQTAYGDGSQEKASVFTPVDYSSCSSSGCMLRFYWLAFQGVDSKIVWQVSSTTESSSTQETSTTSGSGTSSDTSAATEAPSTDAPEATTAASTANEATTETTTDSSVSTPSPSEKCNARKRQ
ncbi:unnamed protein product [Phytophthora lilii]|uniref:Unnamed protein product n=1 Tax=Phytophthora lilii TaxID=2077276 RepID=A0A9W6TJG1_9STRA|nr:unnamed protein product [Phytophthora lilii]